MGGGEFTVQARYLGDLVDVACGCRVQARYLGDLRFVDVADCFGNRAMRDDKQRDRKHPFSFPSRFHSAGKWGRGRTPRSWSSPFGPKTAPRREVRAQDHFHT